MKDIIRAIQLVISDAERHQQLEIDPEMVSKIEEAKSLISRLHGQQVIDGVLAIRKSGLLLTIGLDPRVRSLGDSAPKRTPARFRA